MRETVGVVSLHEIGALEGKFAPPDDKIVHDRHADDRPLYVSGKGYKRSEVVHHPSPDRKGTYIEHGKDDE